MRIDDNSIRIDRNKCIACGICVDRCIMDNLRLSIAPCRQVCPVGMNCQGYIRLIAMDKEEQALEQLQTFGPFVPLIAATCKAPCEKVCVRKKKDGAVHILELKRYMAKKYSKELYRIQVPAVQSKKSVAVIGADVSGLASGFKAILSGHFVTIYARQSDKNEFDGFLKDIITSMEAAGAVFCYDSILEKDAYDLKHFDTIILSRAKDQPPGKIDSLTHLVKDNIFCCNTDFSKKNEPVLEIANAFETVESINRYLNGEPLAWGRGFYTQGGGVKVFKTDPRVGSDEPRSSQEDFADGFNNEIAKKQASRCFGCGRAFEKNQTCWYCLPCELECPQGALEVRIPYLVR